MSRIIDLKKKATAQKKDASDIIKKSDKTPKKEDTAVGPAKAISDVPPTEAMGQPRFVLDPQPMEWSGPTHYKHGSMKQALIFSGCLLLMGGLLYWYDGNLFALTVVILFAIVVPLQVQSQVPTMEYEITIDGIRAGDKHYKLEEIQSFDIHFIPDLGVHELSLHLEKWYHPYIKIPLQHQDPRQVHSILVGFIPEGEHEDTWAERFMHAIGL